MTILVNKNDHKNIGMKLEVKFLISTHLECASLTPNRPVHGNWETYNLDWTVTIATSLGISWV